MNKKILILGSSLMLSTVASASLSNYAALPTMQTASASAEGIKSLRQLNPTTVEVVYNNGSMLTVDFYSDHIFRLFKDVKGGIVRNPQATPPAQILVDNPRQKVGKLQLLQEGSTFLVSSPMVKLSFDVQTGLLSVTNLKIGKVVLSESAAPVFTDKAVELTFATSEDEYFYGGGVQNGRFSHKGERIAIENTNNWVDGGVASPTPFYWSTKGYGILWHTFKSGSYDFGKSKANTVKLTHNEAYLDLFVMVNDKPEALLVDFYQLTGKPVLLPKFGFYEGHLNAYNRDYWKETDKGTMAYEDGKFYAESQKDNGGIKESLNGEKNNYQFSARAAIDRYLNNDMPLGWFLPNDGYGAGYGQTKTLDDNIANLKSFGDYARSKGVEIGLWTQSDLHPKDGVEALLQRDIVKEVRDAGVRVLKTDVAWVGAGYSFGLNGVSDVGQIMPYYGGNARPFIISLDGWAGTQRYAGIWTGDQTGGEWEYIRYHIPTFIGSGLSGQPNITNDLDGIFGGKNLPVNVRDFQWKTFTPMMLNMDGWGSNPKYPQALGEPATSINRMYLKLKSQLMPYTYTMARQAVDGKPLVRALFLDYPNDYTLGTATQYQFLYGSHFLVAPIYKETAIDKDGNDIRNGIYLPEGKWIDYFNGKSYDGGQIINNIKAPLWKLPVFVKSGAIIPMTNANNNPMGVDKHYRLIEIYPDGTQSFNVYDDDGTTEAYKQGDFTTTNVSTAQKGTKFVVEIAKTQGDFNGFEANKRTEMYVNLTQKPKKVTAKVGKKKVLLTQVNTLADYEKGTSVWFYNEKPNLNRFATKGSDFEKQEIVKNAQLWVKTPLQNVKADALIVEIDRAVFNTANTLLAKRGTLEAPRASFAKENIATYELTPSWEKQTNADYYEMEFNGMRYGTITDNFLTYEGLKPETAYTFKVRAVNADGVSPWATLTATTAADPYQWAIKGIKAQITCQDQPGQTVANLFNFDKRSQWHTKWGKGEAVPFDMTIDMLAVNQLEKMEYEPRTDGGNGTIEEGTISTSSDRQKWSEPVAFKWERSGALKSYNFPKDTKARYIRLSVTKAVGNFGSGQNLYVYKVPGTESELQGDINRDKRIDENDLTSYLNYTGLRRGDADFDYVSIGDVNKNDLIDAYDISIVTTQLDGGATQRASDKVSGSLTLKPSKTKYAAGDNVVITVEGNKLEHVNALSFALPYNASEFEYQGLELVSMKDMVNLTYDRLHTNGQKELFACFANKGNNFLLESGTLFRIKLKAKKAGKFTLKAKDGILVDRSLGTANPF